MTSQPRLAPSTRNICWTLLAIAYGVAFMQRMAPLTIVNYLSADLNVSMVGFGTLVAAYFVGYTAMQLPAGILVDVLGVRSVILTSLAISFVGTLGFAWSDGIASASFFRIIVAVGDALVFSCLLKYSASSFPNSQFGLMSGLSQVAGYLGGVTATVPLAVAANAIGWRGASEAIAFVIVVCFILLFLCLPRDKGAMSLHERVVGTLTAAKTAIVSRASWGCALAFAGHFASITSLSGAWAVTLLSQGYGQTTIHAATLMMYFMVATVVGSIAFGRLSDVTKSLFRTLTWVSVVRTIGLILLAPLVGRGLLHTSPSWTLVLLGLFAGGTVPLVLKCLKKIYEAKSIGFGGAMNATVSGLLMILAQPIIAGIAGCEKCTGSEVQGMQFSDLGLNMVVAFLAGLSLLSVVGALLMRERLSGSE